MTSPITIGRREALERLDEEIDRCGAEITDLLGAIEDAECQIEEAQRRRDKLLAKARRLAERDEEDITLPPIPETAAMREIAAKPTAATSWDEWLAANEAYTTAAERALVEHVADALIGDVR